MTKNICRFALVVVLMATSASVAFGQTSAFTYQGNLEDSGALANGSYHFEFRLFDQATDGTQLGATVRIDNVEIVDGAFAVTLDFGDEFPGAERWLEIWVATPVSESLGGLTRLSPRQSIVSVPYAVRSSTSANADTAATADFATNAGNASTADFATDAGNASTADFATNAGDAATADSATTAGTAATAATADNALNLGGVAAGQYVVTTDPRLSDARMPTAGSPDYIQNGTRIQLSSNFNVSGTGRAGIFDALTQFDISGNRVLGVPGTDNLFVGLGAGAANSLGASNSFFGHNAGQSNNVGARNSFFGLNAGAANTDGDSNSFFGTDAGSGNTRGRLNAFFGSVAGANNEQGQQNAFFGGAAGFFNTNGSDNSFFGQGAGGGNTTGFANSFFGRNAGQGSSTGNFNTALGSSARFGAGDLDYATAIGSGALVSTSNTIVLGRSNGSDRVVMHGSLGIGTDSPGDKFELSVNSAQLTMGGGGCPSGSIMIGFFGNLSGCTNYAVRGRNNLDLMFNRPTGGLVIFRENNGAAQLILHSGGLFELRNLASAGSTPLCRNGSNMISTCSSSIRYKDNVERFSSGTDILDRLRPVTFAWKDTGGVDVGLVAEEVAEIEPLLVTYNKNGSVEGVKYDRIGVVLLNVVKEQRKTIEVQGSKLKVQNEELERQKETLGKQADELRGVKAELADLKALVCADRPNAAVCR